MSAMTGSGLAARLSDQSSGMTAVDADLAIKAILAAMAAALAKGGRIEIRGFGAFSLNLRAPRVARNPKTGVAVPVPAKRVVRFKAGGELRERVDVPGSLRANEGTLGDGGLEPLGHTAT